MATVDKRNTTENMGVGGTDVGIAVKLSAEEAEKVWGSGSLAGWYYAFTFEGGEIGRETEGEYDRDEANNLTGRYIKGTDEFVLTNTIKESDDATLLLLDEVLSVTPHDYRYPLPIGTSGKYQVHGLKAAIVKKGWKFSTAAGTKRTLPFELRCDTEDYVYATVDDITDQTGWPSTLIDFKD